MIKNYPSAVATKSLFYITEYSHETINNDRLISIPYNCYLIIYILNGSGCIVQNNVSINIEKDSLLFVNSIASTPTLIKTDKSLECYLFVLNGNNLADYYALYKKMNGDGLLHHRSMSILIKYLFNDLIKLLSTAIPEDSVTDVEVSKLITVIISDLITGKFNQQSSNTPQHSSYIGQVKQYIDENFNQKITLDDLAKHSQISKYQLAHDFKQHFSISPINYLISVRLDEAKYLLVETSQRITVISLSIGFNNTNHFINLFKKQTNLTPLQYRKIYGKLN